MKFPIKANCNRSISNEHEIGLPELVLVELMPLAVEAEHREACGAVEDGVAVGQRPHAALGVLLPRRALLAVAAAGGVGQPQVVDPPLVLVVGVRVVEQVVVG